MPESKAPVQFRPFQAGDLAGVVAAYNLVRPKDSAPLNSDRFWAWFDDPDLSPTRDLWVAEVDGSILGAVAALPWSVYLADAAIFMLGPSVFPAARNQGIARQLLSKLVASCKTRYPNHRILTRVELPAELPLAFLHSLGFQREASKWQLRHEQLGAVAAPHWPAGIASRAWTLDEATAPLEALYAQVLDEPEFLRRPLRAEDLRRWHALGALPSGALQVLQRGNELLGLSLWTRWPGSSEAEFHVWGVLQAFRGQGLGKALLQQAMRMAHEAGAQSLRLELASERLPGFLIELGFQRQSEDCFMALHL